MSRRRFVMPRSETIGTVDQQGRIKLDEGWHGYLGGVEDTSGRVAAYVSGTPTATQIRDALVTAGLMKES